jgi:hypothetical protein
MVLGLKFSGLRINRAAGVVANLLDLKTFSSTKNACFVELKVLN